MASSKWSCTCPVRPVQEDSARLSVGQKRKLECCARQRFEILAVVNGVLVPNAEQQRQLVGVRMRKIVGRHGAKGRDAGSGGDEDGFFGWDRGW